MICINAESSSAKNDGANKHLGLFSVAEIYYNSRYKILSNSHRFIRYTSEAVYGRMSALSLLVSVANSFAILVKPPSLKPLFYEGLREYREDKFSQMMLLHKKIAVLRKMIFLLLYYSQCSLSLMTYNHQKAY